MTTLVAQYNRSLASYEAITTQFQSMLSLLLQSQPLHLHSISGRTKNSRSLADKIVKHKHKYQSLNDITDLCGIRIITYYDDEVDKIAQVIRQNFSVDQKNSIDKRKKLNPTEFGYTSLHLIVNLPVNAKGICQEAFTHICKVEIQIRSILQHAWAEIEHDLEYKNPAGTSDEIRRRFSRMAGLLEVADSEFRTLRDTLDGSLAVTQAQPYPDSTAAKTPAQDADGILGFLRAFPNFGWAAFVTLLFFVLAFLIDWFLGTKITHLATALTSFLWLG